MTFASTTTEEPTRADLWLVPSRRQGTLSSSEAQAYPQQQQHTAAAVVWLLADDISHGVSAGS